MRGVVNGFRFGADVGSVKIPKADFGDVRYGWKADVRRLGRARIRVLRKVSRITQLGLKSCYNPLERLGLR